VYKKNVIKFLNGKKWNESLEDTDNMTLWEFDGFHFEMLKELESGSNRSIFSALTQSKKNGY
jgi:hypothetical protein